MVWELPVDGPPLPVVVGTGFALVLWDFVEVEETFGCDVGVGTKVLIGVEDGDGGVYVEGQVPVAGSYADIGLDAGPAVPYPVDHFQ